MDMSSLGENGSLDEKEREGVTDSTSSANTAVTSNGAPRHGDNKFQNAILAWRSTF